MIGYQWLFQRIARLLKPTIMKWVLVNRFVIHTRGQDCSETSMDELETFLRWWLIATNWSRPSRWPLIAAISGRHVLLYKNVDRETLGNGRYMYRCWLICSLWREKANEEFLHVTATRYWEIEVVSLIHSVSALLHCPVDIRPVWLRILSRMLIRRWRYGGIRINGSDFLPAWPKSSPQCH